VEQKKKTDLGANLQGTGPDGNSTLEKKKKFKGKQKFGGPQNKLGRLKKFSLVFQQGPQTPQRFLPREIFPGYFRGLMPFVPRLGGGKNPN